MIRQQVIYSLILWLTASILEEILGAHLLPYLIRELRCEVERLLINDKAGINRIDPVILQENKRHHN